MTIDLKAIRAAAEADLECSIEVWETSISEIQSTTVIALLDRLEAAEKELQLVRNAALEEAAEIAEYENAADWSISGQIAHQIRSLKS